MTEAGQGRSGDGEQDAPDSVAHSPAFSSDATELEQRRRDAKSWTREARKLNQQLATKEQRIQKILALADRTILHLKMNEKCQHAALLTDWKKECDDG